MKAYLIKATCPGFPPFADCVKAHTEQEAREVWQRDLNQEFSAGRATISSVAELAEITTPIFQT